MHIHIIVDPAEGNVFIFSLYPSALFEIGILQYRSRALFCLFKSFVTLFSRSPTSIMEDSGLGLNSGTLTLRSTFIKGLK